MKKIKSLQHHLIGAFILITFSISTLYGVLVYKAMEYTEDDILNQRVKLEAQHFIRQYTQNRTTAILPSAIGLSSYLSTSPNLPDWLKNQPLGIRELHDKELHINVSALPNNEELLYIVLSELASSNFEQERSFLTFILISIGAVIVLIGLVLGVFLSRHISMPLIKLTNHIEQSDDNISLPFHGYEREDEVGELSRAFSDLVVRLRLFLNREKQFTRYASHELRTPVAIIQNSLAVLRLPKLTEERLARNLNRIENSALDMESLINTFLFLGREDACNHNEAINLSALIDKSLDKNRYLIQNKKVDLKTQLTEKTIIENHPQLISILLDNVIRNMFIYSHTNASIILEATKILFENDIETLAKKDKKNTHSYGLEIIEKISQRCGLTTSIDVSGNRYRLTLQFGSN